MLVRALCTVKLTASDRSWPHMRGAGRSRFAPRIGHIEVTEMWRGGQASQAYRLGVPRAARPPINGRANAGPPGPRASRFRTCTGSPTAQGPAAARASAAAGVAFRLS